MPKSFYTNMGHLNYIYIGHVCVHAAVPKLGQRSVLGLMSIFTSYRWASLYWYKSRSSSYLQEVKPVWSAIRVLLNRLHQIFCIFYHTTALDIFEFYCCFFITPVHQVDICMVTGFASFMCILRPGREKKKKNSDFISERLVSNIKNGNPSWEKWIHTSRKSNVFPPHDIGFYFSQKQSKHCLTTKHSKQHGFSQFTAL